MEEDAGVDFPKSGGGGPSPESTSVKRAQIGKCYYNLNFRRIFSKLLALTTFGGKRKRNLRPRPRSPIKYYYTFANASYLVASNPTKASLELPGLLPLPMVECSPIN